MVDTQKTIDWVEQHWTKSILPTLEDFIRIPNQSRAFDPEWNSNGLQDQAANLLLEWAKAQNLEGAKYEIIKDEDKSPIILIEVEGTISDTKTVLFYGHFDKQPPFTGWSDGLAFNKPVVIDDKLYGRGSVDDGYSIFGAVSSIKICQEQKIPIPRCVILIEGDEESGSLHLTQYLEKLNGRIGEPSLVFCLDSGTLNYDQFWVTSSLRGCLQVTVNVKILNEGVHSGDASGIVPCSFRVLRQLINRIENEETGEVDEGFQVVVPADRYLEATNLTEKIGIKLIQRFPLTNQMQFTTNNVFQAYINNTWKATLCTVGADGFPQTQNAGNVLRPETTLKLSIRLPPTLNVKDAKQRFMKLFTENVPYNAQVTILNITGMPGWNCPPIDSYLQKSIQKASLDYYKQDALYMSGGGTIPLMGILTKLFPKAQFVVTGVGGPGCNAHGPNEFLHIPFTKKIICSIASILSDLHNHFKN
ncbi:M20/M25/M40 family peptidase (macronuclear) [Tetrahymena thermophila SB210]|uniref:M20/M25/M40 family peptidase n=1 Tax=Tetrahymena thermophila (strain SB210) TaxID=312017 RepID=Q23YE0_TETTS|nr:M20/M25/M40 family peptidase [Tetrahymena thermophila SB210]EAS01524.1 M20/M25/M40 family peptidase [Tetrahymena thermophila SB210]|eukprot:XP_001021769.1 M20/M25/M40 family peptidase [Tetrahymena thermophila SB210]